MPSATCLTVIAAAFAIALQGGSRDLTSGRNQEAQIDALIDILLEGSEPEATAAGRQLVVLGAEAVPAIVRRTLHLDYSKRRNSPAVVLQLIGDPAAFALLGPLKDAKAPRTRANAAMALHALDGIPNRFSDSVSDLVVRALTDRLKDPVAAVRAQAVSALRSFGRRAAPATCALVDLLSDRAKDGDTTVQQVTIWA